MDLSHPSCKRAHHHAYPFLSLLACVLGLPSTHLGALHILPAYALLSLNISYIPFSPSSVSCPPHLCTDSNCFPPAPRICAAAGPHILIIRSRPPSDPLLLSHAPPFYKPQGPPTPRGHPSDTYNTVLLVFVLEWMSLILVKVLLGVGEICASLVGF